MILAVHHRGGAEEDIVVCLVLEESGRIERTRITRDRSLVSVSRLAPFKLGCESEDIRSVLGFPCSVDSLGDRLPV